MAEKVPILGKETDITVQGGQRVPNKVNPQKPTPSHTVVKMAKLKDTETIPEAAKGNKKSHMRETP